MITHTLPLIASLAPRTRRIYAMYVKSDPLSLRHDVRITVGAYSLDTFRRLYQDAMLFCAVSGISFRLRSVRNVSDWSAPGPLHLRCIAERGIGSCSHSHVGAEIMVQP